MKIVTVVGARPQFIKAAAVSRSIREFNKINEKRIDEIIVHTGQHYDHNMSDVFFEELEIPKPNYYLGVGSSSHGRQTAEMLKDLETVLLKERPDIVLVYGDTNSTLAGALAASKLHIPIAHVEAGLRSFNRKMPEEVNRVLTDHVSRYLFCPTTTSVENLKREGINERVELVGDVMYDCILHYKSKVEKNSSLLNFLGQKPKEYVLATVHRAENTDSEENLKGIFEAFDKISQKTKVYVALHPRTRKYLTDYDINVSKAVTILDPLPYLQMIELECNASVILTDSGGVQKEAYFAGIPCVTLREETEWVETVKAGANILCGASPERIITAFDQLINGNNIVFQSDLYGDGNASGKIVEFLTGE
ncbi:MAG: non-hydrolyzing UDP-N-acetylglucosamine 2-epimerase [Ignavibacteriales bacterium]